MGMFDTTWLITEEGIFKALDTRKKVSQMSRAELTAMCESHERMSATKSKISVDANGGNYEEPEFQRDYMVQRFGPLAVVTIAGTLVNNDDRWNRYFGEVGYPEIRDAVMEAVDHPEVKAILLNMDTPGGQVSGITETFDFLQTVDKKHKPIYTHASSSMASGGYWLGVVGRRVTTSELAVVGSIGVVTVHASYERMYKEKGIDITVLRQGEFKALGNPYEKLSEKAKTKIEEEMKVIYDTFLTTVSDAREIPVPRLKDTAAEGRVFYGKQAVEVGLADAIESFDEVASKLIKQYSKDSSENSINTNSGTGVDMTKKRVLSEQGRAAIAAGVPEATVLADESLTTLVAEGAAEGGDKPAETQTTEKTPEQIAAEQAAASPTAAPAATQAPAASESASVVAQLMKEIRDSNTAMAALQVQLAEAVSAKTKMEVSHEKLVKIAVASIQRMQVAIGGSPVKMEGMDASVVVDQYHQVLSQFNSKFKVGASAEVPGNSNTGPVAAASTASSPVETSAQKLTKI